MEYKSRLLELIDEYDRVCRENNLRYFLTGGSLLGAIRHNGMIPWDDDIDVAMPREDYEMLRQIANDKFSQDFSYITNNIDSEYFLCYAKLFHNKTTLVELQDPFYLGGVYLDIFPIDGLPSNKFLRSIHYKRFYYWRNMSYIVARESSVSTNKNPIKAFCATIRNSIYKKIFSLSYVLRKCDRIASKYSFDNSDMVVNFGGAWGQREITYRSYLVNRVEHSFEGRMLMIPKGYDEFLKTLYGDYMQLPSIENRISHHRYFYLNLNRRVSKEDILNVQHQITQ